MPDEIDALVKFSEGWEQDGTGKDGLPTYRSTTIITLSKPPLLQVGPREATEEEKEQFAEAYKLFEKTRAGRDEVSGYPLALWPAIYAADYQMCAARGIYTVEQLAAFANKKNTDVPAPIIELAKRAKRMVELQKEVGQFEARIHDLEGQVEALDGELKEARATIAAQNSLINTLRPQPARAA